MKPDIKEMYENGCESGLMFYENPAEIDYDQIDPLMRDAVRKINESGWLLTAESCQGHPESDTLTWAGNMDPMLRLVCLEEDIDRMMGAILRSSFMDDLLTAGQLRVYPSRIVKGRCETLVYWQGGYVFARNEAMKQVNKFAELVSE